MSRLLVLDAGPVGLGTKAPGRIETARFLAWLRARLDDGDRVAVAEIARYEVRRELFRLKLAGGLERLDQLQANVEFLPITSLVMDVASELWAGVRNSGVPTATDDALDGDAILAAQAMAASDGRTEVVIATTNVVHLSRFPGVDARQWWTIV